MHNGKKKDRGFSPRPVDRYLLLTQSVAAAKLLELAAQRGVSSKALHFAFDLTHQYLLHIHTSTFAKIGARTFSDVRLPRTLYRGSSETSENSQHAKFAESLFHDVR